MQMVDASMYGEGFSNNTLILSVSGTNYCTTSMQLHVRHCVMSVAV